MGLFNFLKSGSKKTSIDLTDFKFVSNDHTRIENGKKNPTDNKGAWRGIRIESTDGIIFKVTIYNLDGTHPIWGNNIQMAPKQMKLYEETKEKISLRGFGHDTMGGAFSDYGITLHLNSQVVHKVSLHMYDRNIEIIYLKGNPADTNKSSEFPEPDAKKNINIDLSEFINFKKKWDLQMPMQEKMLIAMQSDNLNNKGAVSYSQGNIDYAINCFTKALDVMPINDDALKNLRTCYLLKNNPLKVLEIQRKLDYLTK